MLRDLFKPTILLQQMDAGGGGSDQSASTETAGATGSQAADTATQGAEAGGGQTQEGQTQTGEGAVEDDDLKDVQLSRNLSAEIARKRGTRDKLTTELADLRKQIDEARAGRTPLPEGDDGDETAGLLRKFSDRLDALEDQRSGGDVQSREDQIGALEDEIVQGHVSETFALADKLYPTYDDDLREEMHEFLENKLKKSYKAELEAGRDPLEGDLSAMTREAIKRWRIVHGKGAEAQLRDTQETKDKTRVQPGSGTVGTHAQPSIHQMDTKQRQQAARDAAKAAESM